MENFTVIPMTAWQPVLSERPCAASALVTVPVQGIAARPAANGAFGPFAAADAAVATDLTDLTAVKRDRATGTDVRGIAAHVPGVLAWSPPS